MTGSSPSPVGGTVAGGMSPDGSALELEADEEDVERELDELLRSDVVALASLLALVLEPVAVVLPSSLPRSSHSATPTAASTTTPATTSAISVFLLPFDGCPPGPPGGAHCWP